MVMTYAINEIYYTLQGEGAHTGRPAVFCRFAGCNLWSGREADRDSAVCQFCDTDFVGTDGPGGGTFSEPETLAAAVAERWPGRLDADDRSPYVVCTGGEPLLQLDDSLVDAFHRIGFEVGVETNGTQSPPAGLDWICVSPKAGAELECTTGDELKLVYPQDGLDPDDLAALDFAYHFLQPKDGPDRESHTERAAEYCLDHPKWRLSIQTHKYVGLA